MKKRMFSIFCVLALCMAMFPVPSLAIEEISSPEDSITITDKETSVLTSPEESTQTSRSATETQISYLDSDGQLQICDSAAVVSEEDTAWSSGWYVVNDHVTVNERITVTGDVHLILAGDCSLNAGAGITVSGGNRLTIYGHNAGTGFLSATAANDGEAGIGGNNAACGTVVINGGSISATGAFKGAGIGGGSQGNGGTITINGGTITAAGGYSGAGIGGGWDASGGTIRITGGTVNASSEGNGADIGDGGYSNGQGTSITISGGVVTANGRYGIGRGTTNAYPPPYQGSFSTDSDGTAVIFTSVITDQSEKKNWSGVVFFHASGAVYGDNVILETDVTIPDGYTLTIPVDRTLTIAGGVTVTNNGTIESYGKIEGPGTIANHPANERMILELFNQTGETAAEFIFGDAITLKASGTNLPADGGLVEFFYGTYSLGTAVVANDAATLVTVIPSHDEPDVSCGSVQFQAKAGTVTGLKTARVRLQVSMISAPTIQSVTSTSVTLNELDLSNGCDLYAPSVTCEYYDVTAPDSKYYSNSLMIKNLQPDTTYSVQVRINQDDRYCETAYSSPITVTTAPAQTALPAGGLDLAYGSVSIEPGESGKLSIRHNNEIYSIDSSTDIRLTGKWAGNPDSRDVPVSVGNGANAQITLSNVVIEGSSESRFDESISISGAVVRLTLEGDSRISGGWSGIWLSSSTLTVVGDGSLTIGSPDQVVERGIEGSDASLYLNGGHLLVYERFSSSIKDEAKTAVTIPGVSESGQSVSIQALGLSSEGSTVSDGWCASISESGVPTLYLPTDNGTYLVSMLVNNQLRQFEITLGENTTVTPVAKDLSVTLPSGTQLPLEMEPDGSLTLPDGSTVQAGNGPKITVSGDGATVAPDGSVTLPSGGSATVTDDKGNSTTITVPETGGTIVPNEDGSVSLPDGSTVQTGSGPEITVSGDGATVAPDGSVTLPSGGSATVTDDKGHTTTITVPETGGTIAPNEDGSIRLPDGSTVQAGNGPEITVSGDGSTVASDGGVTLPDGGSATVTDDKGNTTTITMPEGGGTITPNEDGSINLPGGSSATVSRPDGESTTITIPEAGGTLDPSEGTITRYYTVTFDSNGGSSIDSVVVTENTLVIQPADPTREGYTFIGWYQDEACTVSWNFQTTKVTGDITLYAGWKQTGGSSSGGSSSGGSSSVTGSGSNVSISANGGSVSSSQMDSAVNKADKGSTITIKATGSTSVSLPVDGMADAAAKGNDILIDLRHGEITLSAQAIAGLTDGLSSSSKIKVSLTSLTSSKNDAIADLLELGAAVFDVSVEVDGRSVHSFDGNLTISFSVPNLSKMSDPHVLHILTDGTKEYYVPDRISGNTVTVKNIRNLSTFAVIPGSQVPQEQSKPFSDIATSDYYYDAVLWAVENGVTSGISATTFGPNVTVTRAQMMTFLWRAHGSPKVSGSNPFTDVSVSDYYYDAVLWAVANGITSGTSATTFGPDNVVNRAQAVTFQWRAAGSPAASGSSFVDVSTDAYYAQAVAWAVTNGITGGTGSNQFGPDLAVSRAQAVTFLYQEQK